VYVRTLGRIAGFGYGRTIPILFIKESECRILMSRRGEIDLPGPDVLVTTPAASGRRFERVVHGPT
jgi:hypothetical protein